MAPEPSPPRTVHSGRVPRSIFAVIVLYATDVAECISLRSLLNAAAQLPPGALNLQLVLYDNTPRSPAEVAIVEEAVRVVTGRSADTAFYVHDANNSGLATAYNRALRMALDEGYEWLLTLDQDTELASDSLALLLEDVASVDNHPDVAAIVPQIRAGGRIVSPNWFLAGAWPRWFPAGFTGISGHTTFAFNSGSLLRTAALRQAGGYSPWFWLDNSDSNLYRQLARLGKRVFIAGHVELMHDFSMHNMQARVSLRRYETMLLAESAFWDLEMNALAGLERTLRLAVRLIKHRLRGDSPELRRLTAGALRSRLLHSRRDRIKRWKDLTGPVIARFGIPEPIRRRTKVSVCMAAYNGERFVREQLDSIVAQLSVGDEIIVIDDRSTDGTLAQVEQFCRERAAAPGPQIKIMAHKQNCGVVRTFEEALRAASGDILFLADDDDCWAPAKVQEVLAAFSADPDLQIVSSGLELIDEEGQPIAVSSLMRHRRFSAGVWANLRHNQFQGSTLALRSSALQHVLPFPKDKLFLHDAWIGLRTILRGGKIRHLDKPLLAYRRHGANVSRRFSIVNQVKLRLQLIAALLRSAFHKL